MHRPAASLGWRKKGTFFLNVMYMQFKRSYNRSYTTRSDDMKQLHEKKKGTSPVYRKVAIVSIQLRIILNILGTLVAVTFGYFIGSEGTAQITTGKNILLSFGYNKLMLDLSLSSLLCEFNN